ncbi:MAG TPA: T9SS type A sorting domain-containing protein [Bacteroidia bacterium]|nr:T9SS type A sorting domain-containing protein [Bacteroidia bacterium]
MKKLLLTGMVTGLCFGAFAQNSPSPVSAVHDRFVAQPHQIARPVPASVSGDELPLRAVNPSVANVPTAPQHRSSMVQTIIGTTTYDLQTNGSVENRLVNVGGHLSATWTYSADATTTPTYPDRGTGYNYYNGSSWGPTPTSRIETDRRGWPAIAVLSNGGERVVSHASVTTPTAIVDRAAAGTGTWNQTPIPAIPGTGENTLWARTASGGPDGNTLHMIDITYPTANQGVVVNGLDGFLNYSRSLDGGANWDIVRVAPPGIDDTEYNGFRADAYAIDCKDNIVAFVSGGLSDDWALWKSTDNGANWTRTVIMDFPFTKYDALNSISDVDGDGIADTVFTTDGAYEVLIDHNGMVHAWAGSMFMIDPTIADNIFFFPGTEGLLYWNESMGSNPPVVIAQCPDRDGDGMLSFADSLGGRYGVDGICSMPSAGIDPAGNIYVSYSPLMENTDTGLPASFSYRNVFIKSTSDGGNTWSDGYNVSNSDFDEAVFASMAKDADPTCVHIIWQQDGSPGYAVPPNGEHPVGNNDIIYDCVDPNLVLGINSISLTQGLEMNIYPNPASSHITLTYKTEQPAKVQIEIRNVMGQVVRTLTENVIRTGTNEFNIQIADLANGIYSVNTIIGEKVYAAKFVKN